MKYKRAGRTNGESSYRRHLRPRSEQLDRESAKVLTCNFDLEITLKQPLEVLECFRSFRSVGIGHVSVEQDGASLIFVSRFDLNHQKGYLYSQPEERTSERSIVG